MYNINQSILDISNYIADVKNSIDKEFHSISPNNTTSNTTSNTMSNTTYIDFINKLDDFEKNAITNLKHNVNKNVNKNVEHNVDVVTKITLSSKNTNINQFDIGKSIYGDKIILYLSKYKSLIRINRYIIPSDIIDYKENISTYPKLLAHIAYHKIQSMSKKKLSLLIDIDMNIECLDLNKFSIYNLDHINNFPKLKILKLNLQYLEMYRDIHGDLTLPNLKELHIKKSYLTPPSIRNLPSLKSLLVTKSITPLDIYLLPFNHVKEISFTKCELDSIFDIELPESLELLDLSDNNLTDIVIVSKPNLLDLNLSYNEIDTIKLIGLNKLNILNLSYNKLTTITLGSEVDQIPVKSMRYIGLHYNNISEVIFLDNDYDNNEEINDKSPNDEEINDKSPNNEEINDDEDNDDYGNDDEDDDEDDDYGNDEEINDEAPNDEAPNDEEDNKTQVVELSNNKLTSIDGMFNNMPYLTSLDISNNLLTTLPSIAFPNSPNIKSIDISKNMITNISSSTFSNIKDLKYCNIN